MARKFDQGLLLALAIATLVQCSTAQTAHVVGGAMNWIVPPGGTTAYSTWAANQTFNVGDILEFNFATGRHDVAEVPKAAFDACNTANPISRVTTSPANITLNSAGEHYYICTFTGHCGAGQKLAVNVSSRSSSPAPQPSSPAPQPSSASPVPTPSSAPTPTQVPTSAPTPAPTGSPVTYIVGDSVGLGWTVPPNGSEAYQLWARGKTFKVGDTLVFNYIRGTHDVAEITKEAYGSCDTNSTLSLETNPPTRITLTTSGEHYFTCTYPRHCSLGQKLAINVTGSNTVSPGSSPTGGTAPSTPTTPSSPSPAGAVTPPPSPGNSAKSLGVALSSTFLAIFVGFLY